MGQLRKVRLRVALVLLAVFAGGCHSSPTSASPSLPLTEGATYLIEVEGYDFPPQGTLSKVCDNLGTPRDGKAVTFLVTAKAAGGDWQLRSSKPSDSAVLTIRGSGKSIYGIEVSGELSGSAVDVPAFTLSTVRDVTLVASGVSLTGTLTTAALYTTGDLYGSMDFSDSHGHTGHCSQAVFSLQPHR